MINYTVRKPTNEDVEYMIEHVRDEDITEIEALNGNTIRDVFNDTPDLLDTSHIWEVEGKPVAIFGITRRNGPLSVGIIWLIATKEFHKHTIKFARYCREVFEELIKGHGYIYNYVHEENKSSIEWLKWLGFKVHDGQAVGYKGAIFHKFEMRNV